ncbi:hypothetical protein [Streptomyces chartreusis]|uniref:hypothetical protein n=1 Tax=Streptomyces chartreusis TaxID=1969 RepID=UPI003654F130
MDGILDTNGHAPKVDFGRQCIFSLPMLFMIPLATQSVHVLPNCLYHDSVQWRPSGLLDDHFRRREIHIVPTHVVRFNAEQRSPGLGPIGLLSCNLTTHDLDLLLSGGGLTLR